jgi:endonuclease/exonuclease/phosphatase family metal-dependent hydrolase
MANRGQIAHRERHRPDRLLANAAVEMSVVVEPSTLSDHYPIICEITLDNFPAV